VNCKLKWNAGLLESELRIGSYHGNEFFFFASDQNKKQKTKTKTKEDELEMMQVVWKPYLNSFQGSWWCVWRCRCRPWPCFSFQLRIVILELFFLVFQGIFFCRIWNVLSITFVFYKGNTGPFQKQEGVRGSIR